MGVGSRITNAVTLLVLLASSAAQAEIFAFETRAGFEAAIESPGVDTYAGFSVTEPTPSPMLRSAGPHAYLARTESSFYGAGSTADPWLSTARAEESITFDGFSAGVGAVGANVFGSGLDGAFRPGDITVTVTDGDQTLTRTYGGATTSSFYGVISTRPPITFKVTALQVAGNPVWPTVDNLTLAAAGPVDRIFRNGFD